MRAELPWNVAGIPPEAREAARAAARREGLSVGEWLTRRILRSFSGMEEELAHMAYENRASTGAALDSWGLPLSAASRRDTEEMMARVGRSESESNEAWRRIEDQLRGLSRRLDSSERNHGESNRVISRTAQEMNIAAREQAQAFDQLGLTVTALNERLERLERSAAHDGIRDAVKALHQGLSRLADQITNTANNSASQAVQLTSNLEQLADRVGQARLDWEEADRTLEARIDDAARAAASRCDAIDRSVDTRVAAVDTRLSSIEKTAQFNTNALDHALEKLEASANQRATDQVENQKRASRHEETLHRLEDSIARLEMRLPDAEFERRVDGIERSVRGMTSQLEDHGSTGKLDASLQAMADRLDAMEKDYNVLLTESRSRGPQPVEPPTSEAFEAQPSETIEPAPAAEPVPADEVLAEPAPFLDYANEATDTFAEPVAPQDFAFDTAPEPADAFTPTETADAFTPTEAADEVTPTEPADTVTRPEFEDVFVEKQDPQSDDFLAQARRSARAASEKAESEGRSRLGAFRWSQDPVAGDEEKTGRRYLLPALVGMLVVVIAAAALVLSQHARHSDVVAAPMFRPTAAATRAHSAPSPAERNDTPFAVAPQVGGQHGDEKNFATQRSELDSQDLPARVPVPVKQHDARDALNNPAPQASANASRSNNTTTPIADKLVQFANAGNPVALTILGLRDLDGGNGASVNVQEAVKFLSQAAEKGQAVAQYRLGTLYERGQGIPADPAKAAHWYEMSANQGNRKAMHNLAVSYASGATGKKNMAEAARWFAKAAALGLSDSQFNLAVLYERGDGVPQSLLDAYKWYSIAAATGDSESKQRMGVLQTQLSDTDKAAANRSAAAFHVSPLNRSANVPPEPADLGT